MAQLTDEVADLEVGALFHVVKEVGMAGSADGT